MGMVFPHAQVWASMGEDKSTSLLKVMSLSSARSDVWLPLVDAVALFGCLTDQLTEVGRLALYAVKSKVEVCRHGALTLFVVGKLLPSDLIDELVRVKPAMGESSKVEGIRQLTSFNTEMADRAA